MLTIRKCSIIMKQYINMSASCQSQENNCSCWSELNDLTKAVRTCSIGQELIIVSLGSFSVETFEKLKKKSNLFYFFSEGKWESPSTGLCQLQRGFHQLQQTPGHGHRLHGGLLHLHHRSQDKCKEAAEGRGGNN